MKKVLPLLAVLALATGAQAAPPTADQKDEFYKVCYGIAEDAALCSCKADAAMTLIDSAFMDVVIAAMKGATPADAYYVPYNDYIARSNQVCKPNY